MSGHAAIEDFFVVPAVAMLDRPMRAAELADVAGAAGVGLTAEVAADLLARATDLGLVRVAGYDEGATRYVATSLGERAAASLVAADPELRIGLAELERLRTELLATVGHELRTPLTAIRTSVGLLLDPALDPTADQRQLLLGTIARSADRMQRLLAELLDLARLRAGRVEMQHDAFDARDLVRDVAAGVEPMAAARDQRIVVHLPARKLRVGGDRRRLEQALLNLVANAQKFSPSGADVELGVTASRRLVRWTVIDHGPGIGAEDRERLFERFFVGTSDRQGGTGIGLPTALAIAQAHGGTIEVDSEVGRGSTFHLVVPRGDAR
jgi:two-component system NtrC family sensor kinase